MLITFPLSNIITDRYHHFSVSPLKVKFKLWLDCILWCEAISWSCEKLNPENQISVTHNITVNIWPSILCLSELLVLTNESVGFVSADQSEAEKVSKRESLIRSRNGSCDTVFWPCLWQCFDFSWIWNPIELTMNHMT